MLSDTAKDALTYIRYYIELIGTFVEGYDYPRFAADLRTFHAVTRCLEIISEASKRLPADMKARHPTIQWRQMARRRQQVPPRLRGRGTPSRLGDRSRCVAAVARGRFSRVGLLRVTGSSGLPVEPRKPGDLLHVAFLKAATDAPVAQQTLSGRASLAGSRPARLITCTSVYAAVADFAAAFSQLIIQGVPNWSTNMPKRAAQNVSWMGIVTLPFSDSAANRRSACEGSLTLMLT